MKNFLKWLIFIVISFLILAGLLFFLVEKNILFFISFLFVSIIYLASIFLFNRWKKQKDNLVIELLGITALKFFLAILFLFIVGWMAIVSISVVVYFLVYYIIFLLFEVLFFRHSLHSTK